MLLLWSGAAISLAEIYTGGLAAPLGLYKGIVAILLGHLIGGLLLSLGGLISFNSGKNAMEVVKSGLGSWGARVVAVLNILQLLGWSAVMIIQGARGINLTLGLAYNNALIIMTLLVYGWAYYFAKKSKNINDLAVILLLVLTCLLFYPVDFSTLIPSKEAITFMTVLELSIAMPVSWLPVIGDYTMQGEDSKGVFITSFFGYFVASSAMFILGMCITAFTGKDIVEFISTSTVPVVACAVIVLSTVTTTFLDISSAVESSRQLITIKNPGRTTALYCLIGLALSLFFPIEAYQNFLLMIGSVFVPVYSIVILDHFFVKRAVETKLNLVGSVLAIVGIIFYNYFSKNNILVPTILIMVIMSVLYCGVGKLSHRKDTRIDNL